MKSDRTGTAMLVPRGSVLLVRGEEVVVICHDMTQEHYKVEAVDGRRFWVRIDLCSALDGGQPVR